MGEYKLTNKAVIDLSEIWDNTVEVWSETQADKYYALLISYCQEIADDPSLGKSFDGITYNLRGLKASRHIIFYRIVSEHHVEITRILYEGMDLKKRITE